MSDWTSEVTAVEEFGTVEEEFHFTGENTAKVVLRVPWANRINVVNDVLVYARFYPNAGMGAMASSVGCKPVMSRPDGAGLTITNGRIQYDEALLTIRYETNKVGRLEKDESSGILYSEEIEEVIEAQKLNPKNFRWGTDALGQIVTEGPVRQSYSFNIKRTLYNMTSVPSAFFTLPGKTNDSAYTSVPLGATFAAETLLFAPGSVQRTVMTNGTRAFHVPMKLQYRPEGWNKYWNPDKNNGGGNPAGGYDALFDTKANAVHKNFPPADFSTLVF